jgi:hypothetical protein
MSEEVEIPEEIRNLELFNTIQINQTPARTKDRQLYINKLLNCTADEIKNVMFLTTGDADTRNFRNEIESIGAKRQCEQTIGKKCTVNRRISPEYDFTNIDNSRCWLCGYEFMCDVAVDCEHLIPITFAGLFTGIKSSKRVNVQGFTDAFIRAYNTNYLYAHANCNRSKSSIMLLKWDDDENAMVFDETAGKKLQSRILGVAPIKNNTQIYAEAMMENYRNKMSFICKFINDEYAVFLKHGMSMTDYIKYIVSMTQLYFSKKRLVSIKSEKDRRESLNEIASIKEEIREESSNVFDIVKLNEIHTSMKKKPNTPKTPKSISARRLFSASPKSKSNSHKPIANRTRGANKRFREISATHRSAKKRG